MTTIAEALAALTGLSGKTMTEHVASLPGATGSTIAEALAAYSGLSGATLPEHIAAPRLAPVLPVAVIGVDRDLVRRMRQDLLPSKRHRVLAKGTGEGSARAIISHRMTMSAHASGTAQSHTSIALRLVFQAHGRSTAEDRRKRDEDRIRKEARARQVVETFMIVQAMLTSTRAKKLRKPCRRKNQK